MDSTEEHGMWPAQQTVNTGDEILKSEMATTTGCTDTIRQPTSQTQQQPLSQQSQSSMHSHQIMSHGQPPQSQTHLQTQLPPPPPPPTSHHESLDRQMIRHLLNRYSVDEIAKLMQEEASSPALHGDGASTFTSSTYSSVKSEDAPSLFDSGSSIHTGSDDSSKRGSIMSTTSGQAANSLSRKSQSSLRNGITDISLDSDGGGDRASISKQKGAFSCGFCKEENIEKTCTRKNDLKRHIEDFHNTNSQWFCHHRGCQMVFDWQTAYKTHLKNTHGGSRMSLDEARVHLCPQTVFACGFDNCQQVFEAAGDNEAPALFKEYVGHIVKHFDEGSNSGQWSYTTRIKNLLRQAGVVSAWSTSSWVDTVRNELQWHPQSSHILRKRLETKHIGDLQQLIQYALALSSHPSNSQGFHEEFATPVRGQCRMSVVGHNYQPPVAAMPSIPERDPFQFKISRGPSRELATYLASQRRVFVPQTPARSGRSTRAPPHGVSMRGLYPTPPMSSQYSFHDPQAVSVYDSQPQHRHQHIQHEQEMQGQQPQGQQQHQPRRRQQQHMAISQVGGDMMTGDVRNFRSMPDEIPESDMDMGDTEMLDPNFVQHQHQHQQQQPAFSTQYNSDVMSGVAPGEILTSPIAMDRSPFGGFEVSHTY